MADLGTQAEPLGEGAQALDNITALRQYYLNDINV
jgi:hypothetical protein